MRIVFLTGIWPPDVGGPATHGPEFSKFLVDRGHEVVVVTMGQGEPDGPAVRGGRHPPVVALPVAVRPCRSRRHPAGPSGRRDLRDRDLRRRELRLFRLPDAARGKARLRSRLRARPPLRALRRDTGGVPATGHRSGRGAEAGSLARAAAGPRARRPEFLPRLDRRRLGTRPAAGFGSSEPGPRPRDRPLTAGAGNVRLRRASDPPEGSRGCDQRYRPGSGSPADRDRGRAGP